MLSAKQGLTLSVLTTLALLLGGCTTAGPGGTGQGVDASTTLDASQEDEPETSSWAPNSPDAQTTPEEGDAGDFGTPCTENADCESGYCVEGPEGAVCTKTCSEVCPEGYQCKGVQGVGSDLVFICVPVFTKLCNPCQDDTQCVDGACHPIDDGTFCVTACDADADCPGGYHCDSQDEVCLPSTGSCSCQAEFDGGQRPCWTATGAGQCFGIETCDPSAGWTGCTALEPSDEACNYLDEDCDGLADEDFKNEDGVYDTYLNCGACNVSCAFGFPNAAATTCDTSGPQPQCQVVACLPGYAQLNAYQCVPEAGSVCQPCDADEACLGDGAACLVSDEGSYCGQSCQATSDCPEGYGCEAQSAVETMQCVPLTGSCTCNPLNQGLSRACVATWTPASPDDVAYACPGTETCQDGGWGACLLPDEACDGVDDDCDGQVDEDYRNGDGLYDGVDHCGGCGVSCLALLDAEAHASPVCDTSGGFPACTYSCVGEWLDVDGVADNGCECLPQPGQDLPDTSGPGGLGVDQNCDGVDGEKGSALFVSKNGDDGASGQFGSPKRTLQNAIDAASNQGVPFVFVATGAYVGSISLKDGVRVYGGYSATFDVRDPIGYETAIIASTSTVGLPGAVNGHAVGQAPAAASGLEGFVVFGATGETAGASSYAVYLRDAGPALTISGNVIIAGDGADGASGASGQDGASGAAGAQGTAATWLGTSSCSAGSHADGGQGGAMSCGGASASGGTGGTRVCPDAPWAVQTADQTSLTTEHGEDGDGAGGDGGQAGWDSAVGVSTCNICSSSYTHASEGADGGPGSGGVDAQAAGACGGQLGAVSSGGLWVPYAAESGGSGSHGGGGGGGGAAGGVDTLGCDGISQVVGGSGGGGGAGGCGGGGGLGGSSGGGSFAIFASFGAVPASLPNIKGNTLHQGRGGAGGNGGQGGLGGAGGQGGTGGASGQGAGEWPINICGAGGGYGGAGGLGGHGAGGAGGCGGVSYGVYIAGAIPGASVADNGVAEPGSAGLGGVGGSSYGASGPNGAVGATAATNF
ncbi:MAG: hypothetical protein ACPGU1_07825 [Myxococcota bacterium]